MTAARPIVLRCTPMGQCDFHRDRGAGDEKCPGMCDADGCNLGGHYEVGSERVLCAAHAAIVLLARAVSEALAGQLRGGCVMASVFFRGPKSSPRWFARAAVVRLVGTKGAEHAA